MVSGGILTQELRRVKKFLLRESSLDSPSR